MKIVIGAILIALLAGILIFKAVKSGKKDAITMDSYVNHHFSMIQLKNYSEIYDTFHEELKQSISLKEYEAEWQNRIEKFGSLVSWKIYSSNKSYNLFSSETEYDVIVHLSFGTNLTVHGVHHIWKAENNTIKLIWMGNTRGFTEAY